MKKDRQKDDIFELAFSDYLEKPDYDQAEVMLFSIIRRAFTAGWKAAKKPPSIPKSSETSQELGGGTEL